MVVKAVGVIKSVVEDSKGTGEVEELSNSDTDADSVTTVVLLSVDETLGSSEVLSAVLETRIVDSIVDGSSE